MKYDFIIANPPYGKIGNEITQCIVDNIDFGCFINLLPANDYRKWHKENALYQFVDIRSMRTIENGFNDAAVTTMMCKINKNRSYFISEDEFEIENYYGFHKYFYENRRRNHYAFDTDKALIGINEIHSLNNDTTFIIGHRDIAAGHMPSKKDGNQYMWNVEKSIDAEYLSEHLGKHRSSKTDKTAYNAYNAAAVTFKTAKEKDNFTNFVYGYPNFINAIFQAVHIDSYIKLGKVFPKVDWKKEWTPEEILRDYGYTDDEIEELKKILE